MKNNNNFRDNLLIDYLDLLVKSNNRDEFVKVYESIATKMRDLIKSAEDIQFLNKINGILAYQKAGITLGVVK
ncbi:MAG TPA: hypothetical protein DCE23_09625 [Firmicutes bacterium]|nr:hypothetical protein [Bacillota bacterium]